MSRMAAGMIDGVVVVLILAIGYVVLAASKFLLHPRGFTFPAVAPLFSLAASFVVLVVYQTLAWWLTGRTYGDLVMGLRVVSSRGRRLPLWSAFVRSVFIAWFPIGIMWVAVSRENRSVQDVVLRTSVIYDWQPSGGPHQLSHEGIRRAAGHE
ncbi:RDD family protein [Pedococcus sp. KACC 23699]|uniref:RDD family protein n=1 Tax=Pedococcus sp. KACC 23699 TaxID=3149228 RepID=A0AAU7JSV3_9MICO